MSTIDTDASCERASHEALGSSVVPAAVESCDKAAAVFRALGDSNRLRLLSLLVQRELCVSELTDLLQDNLPAISQRLKLLRAERLVRARRQGKHVYYSLADSQISNLIANGFANGNDFCSQGN